MPNFDEPSGDRSTPLPPKDPTFQKQVQRLHQLTIYSRWAVTALLWVCLMPFILWTFRADIALLQDYFTWATVRYALVSHRWMAIALAFCIGFPIATLIWQSRILLFGLPAKEIRHLENWVINIRRQGKSHPLWNWVIRQ
jgi:hypothetical protein